ncbi:MAG: 16S rRNA (guanine(527)-N(7))-methyltransferase RsmG [Synergistaceae bacterium]|nr:16S rRNA (guanine(527)-N(7))-methyltransferase RsmG [Synergistaceae bacterium]
MTIKLLTEKYGIDKVKDMLSYIDMILDRNKYINLTAVRNKEEAIEKHIVDSLIITDIPEYISSDNIIDVGTGAGFPGIPLAIASPEKNFVLLDSTLKRLKVIEEFAEELDIKNIRTVHERAEEIVRKEEYREQFDICVSRAVANLKKLSEWCLPFVKIGGSFIAYKGDNYVEEIEEAKKTIRKHGGKIEKIVRLPYNENSISGHVLIIIKKIK